MTTQTKTTAADALAAAVQVKSSKLFEPAPFYSATKDEFGAGIKINQPNCGWSVTAAAVHWITTHPEEARAAAMEALAAIDDETSREQLKAKALAKGKGKGKAAPADETASANDQLAAMLAKVNG